MLSEYGRAFLLILLAEMGDKTQILAMAFATRYQVKKVILGIFIGVFLNHGLAVALGNVISRKIPLNTVQIIAGIAFVFFGIWTLTIDEGNKKESKKSSFGPVCTVAAAFFIGELGDKTQLAAITLGADSLYPLATLFGTVSGMVVIGALGIFIGIKLGNNVPELAVKLIASFVFLSFGLMKLYNFVPEKYINLNYLLPFFIILSISVAYLVKNLIMRKKQGETSLYLKKSEELRNYYKKVREDINKICLGVENCGICQGTKCTVGQIKELINKGLIEDKNFKVDEVLNEKWKEKTFDEDKIRVGLIMTLSLLKDDFNNSSYENIHKIRINLERMIFKSTINKAENWEDYILKLSKMNEKAMRFVKKNIKEE